MYVTLLTYFRSRNLDSPRSTVAAVKRCALFSSRWIDFVRGAATIRYRFASHGSRQRSSSRRVCLSAEATPRATPEPGLVRRGDWDVTFRYGGVLCDVCSRFQSLSYKPRPRPFDVRTARRSCATSNLNNAYLYIVQRGNVAFLR